MTMADSRPSWDEYFMGIAFQVASRATCDRAHVGAVIVRERRILTTGYNGAPRGLPHCDEVGHLMINGHCVRTLHAEQNAIIQAAYHGISIKGGTIYVTHQPCLTCAKMIINAGLVRVVYAGDYPDEYSVQFLREAGVKLEHFPWPPKGKEAVEEPHLQPSAIQEANPESTFLGHPLGNGAWVRSPLITDAEAIFDAVKRNRHHLMEWLEWAGSIRTPEDEREALRNLLESAARGERIQLSIWVEGNFAGMVELKKLSQGANGEIGYWIGREFQGRGLVTKTVELLLDYGFREMGLHRIQIQAATGNQRSRAIPERLGFTHEGTLREVALLNGAFVDYEVYSILAREWLANRLREP